jgi:hypothetical protein
MPKFHVGQEVVCINDDFSKMLKMYSLLNLPGFNLPRRGNLYVVRDYVIHGKFPAIVVMELHNPIIPYMDDIWREAGFWDERFEPRTKRTVNEMLTKALSAPWQDPYFDEADPMVDPVHQGEDA